MSGSSPLLKAAMASSDVRGTDTDMARTQATGGTTANIRACPRNALPRARLRRKANNPIARVSTRVIAKTALISWA